MASRLRVRMGWGIVVQSLGLFASHKGLAVLPLLSAALITAFVATVGVRVLEFTIDTDVALEIADSSSGDSSTTSTATPDPQDSGSGQQMHVDDYEAEALFGAVNVATVFVLYLGSYLILTFFNVALAACVLSIFEGKPIGIAGGLARAARRLPTILGWSLLASLVGMILQAIESRGPIIGRVFAVFADLVWRLATFFVVPIIASKAVGSIAAVRESVGLIRQTWDESASKSSGIKDVRLFFFLFVLAGVALTHATLGAQGYAQVAPIGLPLLLLGFFFLSTIGTVVSTALYYYASERRAPLQFDSDMLQNTIARKRQ
ncbi:MAG: hypothetical protein Kilf2KO_16270 [Rhodospirillales bacterium]